MTIPVPVITWDEESATWADFYGWADQLEELFPGQDAHNFALAINYNEFPPGVNPEDFVVTGLVMHQEGERDTRNWIWTVSLANGQEWAAEAGCDFTGWDCASAIDWTLMFDE